MKKIAACLVAVIAAVCAVFAAGCNGKDEKKEVAVIYYNTASDLIPMLKTDKLTIGLLPEPAATQLTKVASNKTWYRLDLQELYDSESKAYPQAVVMVKKGLLAAYPDLAETLGEKFNLNAEWIKTNTADAVAAVNSALKEGVTPSMNANNITPTVIDNCKIYWEDSMAAKASVKKYINEITEIDTAAAVKPADDFFYDGNAEGVFDSASLSVYAPDGAPALSIAKFIADGEDFGTDKTLSYTVVSANDIGPTMVRGLGDIIVMPVNAATKLYQNAGGYALAGVVTHGNLYIMSSEEISVSSLVGKTVGVIGQGLVPDLTFKAVLKKYGLTAKAA